MRQRSTLPRADGLSDDIKQYQHFIFIAFRCPVQKVQRFSSFYIITFADDDFVRLFSIYYSYSGFSFHVVFSSRFFPSFIHFHHLLFLPRHFVGSLRSRFLKRFMRIPFGHFHICLFLV